MKQNKDDQPGLTPRQLTIVLVVFALWLTLAGVSFNLGVLQ